MASPRRTLSSAARMWIILGLALVLGVVTGSGYSVLEHFGLQPGPLTGALVMMVVFGLVIAGTIWWWIKADEAVREAHKWAWYWGGSIGMTVGIAVLVLNGMYGGALLPPDVSQDVAMTAGACLVLAPMLIGYGVAWFAWWISKGR